MSAAKIRALLVEDSRIVARFLKETLELAEGSDLEIVHTQRLADAADLLKQEEFDVLLLDLSLPDSRGMDTVVRARALAPGTPIVVLSFSDDPALAGEAVRHGAQDYLVKGVAGEELIMRTIHRVIEGWQPPEEGGS